jgi:hypothetical protein
MEYRFTFRLRLLQYHSKIRLTDPLRSVKKRVKVEPVASTFRATKPPKREPMMIVVQNESTLISVGVISRRRA